MRVAILTISDSVARGSHKDASGPALRDRCRQLGWTVVAGQVLADEAVSIREWLVSLADGGAAELVLTTGGTGIGPRDSTPEATIEACQKLLPGIPEMMREYGRKRNPRAALSRGVAGVRGRALIVNLPGSPRGAVESLDAVAELLPHAIEVLRGARHD
jgi:molybdenum cofactor synthesis domain-containing protein